jgi:hypothetical protein
MDPRSSASNFHVYTFTEKYNEIVRVASLGSRAFTTLKKEVAFNTLGFLIVPSS